MFHLYFGALDVCLYIAAFFVALSLSRSIADDGDLVLQPISVASTGRPVIVTSTRPVVAVTQSKVNRVQALMTGEATVTVKVEPQPQSFDGEVADDCTDQMTGSSFGNQASLKDNSESEKTVLNLSRLKTYTLHGNLVVKLADLSTTPPDSVKRYKLRGEPAVRVTALEELYVIVR